MSLKPSWTRVLTFVLLFLIAVAAPSGFAQGYAKKRSLGSAYLPLDHWAYPLLERAIAKGAIPNQFFGLRPWTRMAIADALEARLRNPDKFAHDEDSDEIVTVLDKEFEAELRV